MARRRSGSSLPPAPRPAVRSFTEFRAALNEAKGARAEWLRWASGLRRSYRKAVLAPRMSASPLKSSRAVRHWAPLVPAMAALLAVAYAGGHLSWYNDTPFGQIPVVDEQENLMLGEMIVRGELPPEPFYRSMGYPLLLATLRGLGVETVGLFAAALVVGVLLHGVNTALVARTAQVWFGGLGGVISGVVFGLNPVLVHYATQALDATPALTFFLIGLAVLAREFTRSAVHPIALRPWIVTSLAWAIAVALRPNYFLTWAVLPVIAAWIHGQAWRPRAVVAALSGGLVFASVAVWQKQISGVAGFLPWQGTYNLWAANQPGAHGRYFVQRVSVPSSMATLNTTRAESIYLYRQETGAAPAGIEALNAHWRTRFISYVTTHPLEWLGRLAGRMYALVNDWDQYNNKTYAFHQSRSPWLRWNPLGWGVTFLLGIVGVARLCREQPRTARATAAIVLTLAAGVLLFFVSGRFRLPLAAIGAVLAGGIAAPRFMRSASRRSQLLVITAVVIGGLLTFSNLGRVRDRTTFVEDHALLARAAERTGDLALAWSQARAALALNPQHRDATRVAVAVYFNQLVRGGPPLGPEADWLDVSRRFVATQENEARDLQAVAVIAIWRADERTAAVTEWRRLGRTPSAMAARLLVGDRTVSENELRAVPAAAWGEPLVRLAGAHLGLEPPSGVPPGDARRAAEVLQRVFARIATSAPP